MAPDSHVDHPLSRLLASEYSIAGPFELFNGSFVLEFFKPDPQRNASVLLTGRYKYDHPFSQRGKNHPQAPPLHLHFSQAETFVILSGRIGTTSSPQGGTIGAVKDEIHTRESTSANPHALEPWTPHQFWPCPDAEEDSMLLMWATPDGRYPPMMDAAFFATILRYTSDISEKKVKLDILQLMLTQHESESCGVILPGAWWLGPLRWWLPWKLEGFFAAIARWQGKQGLIQEYVLADDWNTYVESKKST